MTNTVSITPIKRKTTIIVTDPIKDLKEKKYVNRSTKYIIVK